MKPEQIIAECLARKRLAPARSIAEIVNEVLAEIYEIKAALKLTDEFSEQ